MSTRGMLVSLDAIDLPPKMLEVGERVSVVLELPVAPSAHNTCLNCVGSVVRVEGNFDVTRHQFLRPTENKSMGP